MAKSISDVCATVTHVADPKFAAALASHFNNTLSAMAAFQYSGLFRSEFPEEDTVKQLMTKLSTIDSSISATTDDHTNAVQALIIACKQEYCSQCGQPTISTSVATTSATSAKQQQEAEKARLDAFAITAYEVVQRKTLTLYPASLRATGKDVEKLRADLNRGCLTQEAYQLKLVKSGLEGPSEQRYDLNGGEATIMLPVDGAAPVKMTRNGAVLKQLLIFCGKVVAAGLDTIKADSANPSAGSRGEHGELKVTDRSKTPPVEVTRRYHVLPGTMLKYFSGAIEASSSLTPTQLNAIHDAYHLNVSTYMMEHNLNYGSALERAMCEATWHGMLNGLGAASAETSGSRGGAASSASSIEADLKELRSTNKRLSTELEQARESARIAKAKLGGAPNPSQRGSESSLTPTPRTSYRSTPTNLGSPGVCFDFQKGSCRFSQTDCRYTHECEICGAKNHGADRCSQRGGRRQ